MRLVHGRRAMAVGVVAILLMAGCGDDEESSSDTTVTAPPTTLSQVQLDQQKAQRVLLTAADLPGYAIDPPDPDNENSPEIIADVTACVNNDPVIGQLLLENDPRGAESPDFSKGDASTASSTVTFAETEDLARAAMTALNATTFPACFSRALSAELRRDASNSAVTVTTTKLPALQVGDQSVGFRSVARFRSGGTAVTVNLDSTFIRSGRGLSVLDISSVGTVFPEAERSRLASIIAGRLAPP